MAAGMWHFLAGLNPKGTSQVSRPFQVLTLAATVSVLAAAKVWATDAGAAVPPAGTPRTSQSARLDEVTVTAKRAELVPKVRNFVNQIAVPENGGEAGLARWDAPPVCPLVSGLPRQDGEFILERLSEVARSAGVPIADEHCRPNLYILVTRQPEDLLRAMEKRNRPFTFGHDPSRPRIETSASVVDEFIKTPRAVRVWYNPAERTPEGLPLACPENGPCYNLWAQATHVTFNTIWTFLRVFVIVDRNRLLGVTRGQLADYVAMVSFAKLKTDAGVGDSPTILKLFNEAPQGAPSGLTDWDQSFLKSLYTIEQRSRAQRGEIARAMVREIAH